MAHVLDLSEINFLRFMNDPYSLTRIIAEYDSIIPNRKEELYRLSTQNEICRSENSMQLMRYLHRRVKLSNKKIILDASFIDGYEVKRKYICIKSVQEGACGKFLQAVWDLKVQIIVVMCRLSDKDQYWSLNEGCVMVFDKFSIKTLEVSVNPNYTLTLLSLIDECGQEHKISHYQYTAWPWDDFSFQPNALIDFFGNIKDTCLKLERQTGNKLAPIIVQCPDGVGSSAVFCTFDICISQFDKTGIISLSSIVKRARQQKYGFMSCLHYYVLCYQLVNAYLKKKLSGNRFI